MFGAQSQNSGYPSPYPQNQAQTQAGASTAPQQRMPGALANQTPTSRPQTQAGGSQPTSSNPAERAQVTEQGANLEGAGRDADTAAEPGFFGRLFGRGKNKTPAGTTNTTDANGLGNDQQQLGPDGGDPNQPPVEVANSAGWCASKPMDVANTETLRNAPLAPSRFGFLNPPQVPTGQGAEASAAAAAASPLGSGSSPPSGPAGSAAVTSTKQSGPPPEVKTYGPFLRYGGYDPLSYAYYASVLVVAHQCKGTTPPLLKFKDIEVPGSESHVKAQHLNHYRGYNFWRFDFTILCGVPERTVEYMVAHANDNMFTYQKRYQFQVPGIAQQWRWGFFSGNGFHDAEQKELMGGIQPLWRDVLFANQQKSLHVMIGGGDQIYCDDVWNLPAMLQATVWNDHDIFDGWGSYPVEFQFCPVFQGIFFFARKFYCLFQQHTTPERIYDHNQVFGEFGWNWLGCLGATTAVLLIDVRTERSLETCVRPGTWAMIQQRLAALPTTIKHVVLVTPVPLVYPQVPIVESSLEYLTGHGRTQSAVVSLMQKSGLSSHLYGKFGLPDLLDDLPDRWSAKAHSEEKLTMLHMLQNMSLARGFRFTLLCGGDSHVAAFGRVCSKPVVSLRTDHRFMPQVISSAIGNTPPVSAVVKALTASAKTKMLDQDTQELLIKGFDRNSLLKEARNWCVVEGQPLVPGSALNSGSLTFQIRAERSSAPDQRPEVYELTVPILEVPLGALSVNKLKPLSLPGPPAMVLPLGQQQASAQVPAPAAPLISSYGPVSLAASQDQAGPYGPTGAPARPAAVTSNAYGSGSAQVGSAAQLGVYGQGVQNGEALLSSSGGQQQGAMQQQQYSPQQQANMQLQQYNPQQQAVTTQQQQYNPQQQAPMQRQQQYNPQQQAALQQQQYNPQAAMQQQQYSPQAAMQQQQYSPQAAMQQQQYSPQQMSTGGSPGPLPPQQGGLIPQTAAALNMQQQGLPGGPPGTPAWLLQQSVTPHDFSLQQQQQQARVQPPASGFQSPGFQQQQGPNGISTAVQMNPQQLSYQTQAMPPPLQQQQTSAHTLGIPPSRAQQQQMGAAAAQSVNMQPPAYSQQQQQPYSNLPQQQPYSAPQQYNAQLQNPYQQGLMPNPYR
ncbi:hypothetical protein CEUSTIGMA_g236.t1 [Chlamydomonas eustigma]|uniref:PhoD-like phosphatase domain-containing protein n=1 Tax=Chlamydomonas eustigma TaxID=1157962 RepID=A0A250WQF5_9CHLO|nr:hypothetical protein CEUSTIGMA_g236.t1 [Chlamydomonas eustigma]|eukprot:GAX72780.1 hypothetical protein CEUSTIGMA_g236.t1 [Chlamydomonas eustigma]